MTDNELEILRRDGLKEVASIGAGHAATALSQLTDRRIMISVPQVRRIEYDEVPRMMAGFGDHVAVVMMRMLGDLTGRSLLVFGENDAVRLCDLILRRDPGPPRAAWRSAHRPTSATAKEGFRRHRHRAGERGRTRTPQRWL